MLPVRLGGPNPDEQGVSTSRPPTTKEESKGDDVVVSIRKDLVRIKDFREVLEHAIKSLNIK